MAGGARSILMTRWRTSGRTNFDLVREFAKELPNALAADAWPRACLLAREAPLDAVREPRLKRSDETGDLPTADHPFFWAGYMLVDTGPRPVVPEPPKPAGEVAKAGAAKSATANAATAEDSKLPPPDTGPNGQPNLPTQSANNAIQEGVGGQAPVNTSEGPAEEMRLPQPVAPEAKQSEPK